MVLHETGQVVPELLTLVDLRWSGVLGRDSEMRRSPLAWGGCSPLTRRSYDYIEVLLSERRSRWREERVVWIKSRLFSRQGSLSCSSFGRHSASSQMRLPIRSGEPSHSFVIQFKLSRLVEIKQSILRNQEYKWYSIIRLRNKRKIQAHWEKIFD